MTEETIIITDDMTAEINTIISRIDDITPAKHAQLMTVLSQLSPMQVLLVDSLRSHDFSDVYDYALRTLHPMDKSKEDNAVTKEMHGVVNLERVNYMIRDRLTEAELAAKLQKNDTKKRAESMALYYALEAARYNYIAPYFAVNECTKRGCLDELRDILITATDGDAQGVDDYLTGRPTRTVALAMRDHLTHARCVNAVYNLLIGCGVVECKAADAARGIVYALHPMISID